MKRCPSLAVSGQFDSGRHMALNGYIKLRRGDQESVRTMMAACERAISQGCSVYFFPEGTRSKTGRLKPFKPGAFILAKKMRVPILPVVINGTHRALPKHSLNFHGRHPIEIRVLDEIPLDAFELLSVAETADLVRDRIARHVAEEAGFVPAS